jgi:N-acetylmuramoyl-L-alanine amidase
MNMVTTVLSTYRHACIAFLVSLLFFSSAQAIAKQQLFEAFKRIVVLDPGHGGKESGAHGPDGTLEKTVTLELARLIAAELERDLRVVLTRTDDYLMDLNNRTSLANNAKANLFISIHTGASFVHGTAGTSVYYYQKFPDSDSGAGQPPSSAGRKDNNPILWENVQNQYVDKSRKLAGIIEARLNQMASAQIRIEGAPLAVLQGAAMPAILIEIGYLTNPAEEKKLSDRRFLMDLAEQISRGIVDYFSQDQQ